MNEIGADDWRRCFPGSDVLTSYELMEATEASQLEGVRFDYLVLRERRSAPKEVSAANRRGTTVAIAPCFCFRTSLTVAAPPRVQRAVAVVRKWLPKFLYLDVFVVGTPIAICRDLIGIRPDIVGPRRQALLRTLVDAATARARAHGISFVAVKEIPGDRLPEMRAPLGDRFRIVASPATTFLYLGEPGVIRYRERLRNKYRWVMGRHLRRFERSAMRWETARDFSAHAEAMHALYMQVLTRSRVRFETLSVDFFRRIPDFLGDRAFALLCFQRDELVAFELFLQDDHWLHPIYLGMSYVHRDEGSLYFSLLYKIIELAEAQGRAVVQLGQTSYPVKAAMGAVTAPLHVAVRHDNRLLDWLLRRTASQLFPPTPIPPTRRVFRDMQQNNDGLRRHGIRFESHSYRPE